MTDDEMFKVMAGMDEVNKKMHEERMDKAPMCHFRKMFYDQSDSTDDHYEEWWECSFCGHTIEI